MLTANDGSVKLADFGLARSIREKKDFTPGVATLWYRAPELMYLDDSIAIKGVKKKTIPYNGQSESSFVASVGSHG